MAACARRWRERRSTPPCARRRRSRPTRASCAAFHAEHAALFSSPRRVRVRAISFDASRDPDAALQRAQSAASAIAAGLAFEAAAARFGDPTGPAVARCVAARAGAAPPARTRAQRGGARARRGRDLGRRFCAGASVHLLELASVEPARPQAFEAAARAGRRRVRAPARRRRRSRAGSRSCARRRASCARRSRRRRDATLCANPQLARARRLRRACRRLAARARRAARRRLGRVRRARRARSR